MKRSKAHKTKKYSLVLNECEMRRLNAYAASLGVPRTVALSRIMRQGLREAVATMQAIETVDANQLGLFDTIQVDIFNHQTKVKNTNL